MDMKFEGGVNIALKIPEGKYGRTVSFYRDVLKLEVEERDIEHPMVSRTHRVKFDTNVMWLDCVDNYTPSETWLGLNVDDVEQVLGYSYLWESVPVLPSTLLESPVLRSLNFSMFSFKPYRLK